MVNAGCKINAGRFIKIHRNGIKCRADGRIDRKESAGFWIHIKCALKIMVGSFHVFYGKPCSFLIILNIM